MWKILLGEFLGDLQAQRTRALLTFFAVAWGTLSVVLLLAFGEGLKRAVTGGLLAAGDRILMVGGGETSKAWQGLPQGRRIFLVEEDLELLRRSIPELDRGAPSYGRYGVSFQVDRTRTNAYTEGAGPDHEEMRQMFAADGGRFINEQDVLLKRRVVFLGTELRNRLYGKDFDPVGL
ncbi:MAG TPA: ABC transporter permease, partial [Gemmatimonadales bacterium]